MSKTVLYCTLFTEIYICNTVKQCVIINVSYPYTRHVLHLLYTSFYVSCTSYRLETNICTAKSPEAS